MWRWVLTFLGVSIVAGMYAFSGITTGEAGFAKVLFFVFVVGLGISVVAWLVSGSQHRS